MTQPETGRPTSPSTGVSASPATSASRGTFVRYTVIAAVIAAAAAYLTVLLGLQAWAMFVGWVTWFIRPGPARQGLRSVACLWAGMILGLAGHHALGFMSPTIGYVALPITVFVIACIAVGLRTSSLFGTTLAWFLGLIAFFAPEADNVFTSLLTLLAGSAIGAAAAYACQLLQRRFAS